jgi:hypothetical protein
MTPTDEFVTFEIHRPANGFERGWYFRMTSSLHNEPVGPYLTRDEAEEVARAAERRPER